MINGLSSAGGIDANRVPWINILGVKISAVNLTHAVEIVADRIDRRRGGYVCVRDVHGVMLCRGDQGYRKIHNTALMVVPDGMPLVWMARLMGHRRVGRASGTDFMLALCERSLAAGWRHYFYGGGSGIAERLVASLRDRFPRLVIAGAATPPFGPATQSEQAEAVGAIQDASPDLVWIGTGTPAQERWMSAHQQALSPAILIGVGAAFDFVSESKRRAPRLLRNSGLEWLHRLLSEPRRLWRRYLLITSRFLPLATLQLLGRRPPPVNSGDGSG